MRIVVGTTTLEVSDAAIDDGLTLKGPLSRRNAAVGLVLPEYLIDDYSAIADLSVWRWPIPNDAFVPDKKGRRFCTPEFTFLLLARLLDVKELALFGLELCGTYAIDANDSRGFVTCTVPETTVDKLRKFLDSCPGAPDHRKATSALKYIADRSASPMESVLVLLLCLPRRLGGFGLPMPELNVSVDELKGLKNSRKGPIVDLIWRIALFSLEYDSDMFHTGADRIANDSRRRAILAELGIQSLSVTNEQIKDPVELERIAKLAAKALNKKFHKVSRDLRERNNSLREQLCAFTYVEPKPDNPKQQYAEHDVPEPDAC